MNYLTDYSPAERDRVADRLWPRLTEEHEIIPGIHVRYAPEHPSA